MSIQSCSGKKIDNKIYNFLLSPTDFITERLPGSDITQQTPDNSSNIFFTQRDFKKLEEEKKGIMHIILCFIIPICTYIFFHFLILKKLFHGSTKARIVLGIFIPITIYTCFFTNLNVYIVLALIGLGMSCFEAGKIKEELEKQ
jgi:hypothetical protein